MGHLTRSMGGGITGLHTEGAAAPRPLTYLACPYTHPDRAVRVARFEAANRAAGHLMGLGHKVFSPISHTHPIAEVCDLPLGWDFWAEFDRAYLSHTCLLVVLQIDGWDRSTGVKAEIAIAAELGIPVEYMDAEEVLGGRAARPVADCMR